MMYIALVLRVTFIAVPTMALVYMDTTVIMKMTLEWNALLVRNHTESVLVDYSIICYILIAKYVYIYMVTRDRYCYT